MTKHAKCARCKHDFVKRGPTSMYCQEERTFKCKICKNPYTAICKGGMTSFCSRKCAYKSRSINRSKALKGRYKEIAKKRKATMKERYGVENTFASKELRDKAKNTMQEKYGVQYAGSSKELMQKRKQNNLEKYGTEEVLSLNKVQKKIHKTVKDKYGVDNVMQADSVQKKQADTNMKKYGVKNVFSVPEIRKKSEDTMIKRYGGKHLMYSDILRAKRRQSMLEHYGVPEFYLSEEFKNIMEEKGNRRISKTNQSLKDKIEKHFNLEVEYEKVLDNYAYDLHIKDTNILIEINPTITHNSTISFVCIRQGCVLPCHKHQAIDKNYHYQKAQIATKYGYNLIEVYDWTNDKTIIKDINNILNYKFDDSILENQIFNVNYNQYELGKDLLQNGYIEIKPSGPQLINTTLRGKKIMQESDILNSKNIIEIYLPGYRIFKKINKEDNNEASTN